MAYYANMDIVIDICLTMPCDINMALIEHCNDMILSIIMSDNFVGIG